MPKWISKPLVWSVVLALFVTQWSVISLSFAATTTADRQPPTNPANLKMTTRTTNSITINWSASRDNVGVRGYHIYRDGRQIAANHPTTTFTDRNLTADRAYSYTVRALDRAGNASRSSNILRVRTAAPAKEAFDPRYGVYYEIFVRAFADSNGDGIGDFKGIIDRLDYLNDGNPNTTTDLGVDAIWLMPIFPSPSYHGYDVTDYYNVNPQYGTLDDFKRLLRETEKRGVKVIIDKILNHSGSGHPWFQDAVNNPNGKYRNWYVWAKSNTNLSERSAVSGNAWHRAGGGHYLAAFWSGMPDLNFDNPEVRQEAAKIGKFWLQMGVDGFRMDAAKHIFDDLASSKANPQTAVKNIKMWQEFRAAIDTVNPNAYMIGEVWDSKEVIAPYLDRAYNSAFNFDLADAIVNAVDAEIAGGLGRMVQMSNATYREASKGRFVDSPFLTNHDQTRVMSVLQGNVNKAKLAASILLTMPGTPYLYYGEEVGMQGAKPDENIRLPFPWYANGNGPGQTRWRENFFVSEENRALAYDVQRNDPNSLFNHYRKLIHLRKKHLALHQGDIKPYEVDDFTIEAYMRFSKTDRALVVHNLSDQARTFRLKSGPGTTTFSNIIFSSRNGTVLKGLQLTVPAYGSVILK